MILKHKHFLISLLAASLFLQSSVVALAHNATHPLNFVVNGSLTISDANTDNASGKDPTVNVNLSVTPDLGSAEVAGSANFRIRSNMHRWRLTAQRTQEIDGGTNINTRDVKLVVTTEAGSTANRRSGILLYPFRVPTNISSIPTNYPRIVVYGINKTSKQKDSNNLNNYYQVNTNYSIEPDFFYEEGTWETTISYNLTSP